MPISFATDVVELHGQYDKRELLRRWGHDAARDGGKCVHLDDHHIAIFLTRDNAGGEGTDRYTNIVRVARREIEMQGRVPSRNASDRKETLEKNLRLTTSRAAGDEVGVFYRAGAGLWSFLGLATVGAWEDGDAIAFTLKLANALPHDFA